MKKLIRTLVVEDNALDAEILIRELQRGGFDPKWKRVETESAYLAELETPLDLIISDYSMPQFSGLRAAELLQKRGVDVPFILVSGTVGEEAAVEAMKRGATDYMLKDRTARLVPAVKNALKQRKLREERKQLEEQFIQAQKMEVVGQLAGGVAHDFNNILAVIMGYAGIILQDLRPEDALRPLVEEIRSASERAAALTRQLLVFSRKQTMQPVVLQINDVLKEMNHMLRRLIDESIEFTISPGPQVGQVNADSGYLGQVIMNLVVNARDAMPSGGKLTIRTANVTLEDDYVRTHPGVTAGNYVMFEVSDTGTGMTDQVKARLFEAFFTTKPEGKGTGLGLSTCQTIITQCAGHIAVESQLGKGTTFNVYLPRVDQAVDAAAKSRHSGPLPRGTETLLIVEDEPSLRHLTTSVMESFGYTVLRASSGQDGMRVARQHVGSPIRLVITDVIMPQMNGKVMADWLKVAFPHIKVLFTSGYTDATISHHGVLDPGVQFLAKPYTPVALAYKVREVLDAKN